MSNFLDIQPREMKFVIVLNKQSRSTVRLHNKTDQHVAFKVKTTSPKKYCVRPNVGVLQPKAALEFIVIMQALKQALPDMTCKDKFLIQSRIVTAETKEEELTSEMFPKKGGEGIEESKLRVFLVMAQQSQSQSQSQSQEVSSINSTPKEQQADEQMGSKTVKNEDLKPVKSADVLPVQDVKLEPIKNMKIERTKSVDSNMSKDVESEVTKVMDSITRTNDEPIVLEPRIPIGEMGEEEQKLFKEIEDMKSNIQEFESKISKAEAMISKLTEEKMLAIQDSQKMQQEMAILRRRKVERKVQDGFPLLFVCMVAAITLVVGYGFDP